MNAEMIDKNERYYFELVNQKREGQTMIEYINPFVPQMYDHNFFYLKEGSYTDEIKAKINSETRSKNYLKFFGKVADTQMKAKWTLPIIPEYEVYLEELMYVELTNSDKLEKATTSFALREVRTAADFQRYCQFTYESGLEISVSFAEEKVAFLKFLHELEEVRFYIALAEDKVVGSVDCYKLTDYYKIENVFVTPAFRKQGVAGSLIKLAVASREDKEMAVALATEVEGEAKTLYEKLGFTPVAYSVNQLLLKKAAGE